ncbi:MAG TPA: hypothetical protein PKY56_00630 [Candidatus Kapabacteria bacterium]|nr:hypothetical protein [Candidatus Kapabacteria bacterium]HPO61622.1 hypothetical protein [Candidatus Kapabacteria bacterium]
MQKEIFKKWWFWVIVVFALGLILKITGYNESETKQADSTSSSKELTKEEIAKSKEHDSLAAIAKEGNKKIDFINEIKGNLENLKIYQNTFYGTNFKSYSPVEILNVLNNWTDTYKKIYNSTDNEILEFKTEYYKLLSKALKVNYPALRKYYTQVLSDKMWEHNWKIKCNGNKNTVITFTATAFSNNKNIKDAYETIVNELDKCRFKKANFIWSDFANEYTSYTINSIDDLDDIKDLK